MKKSNDRKLFASTVKQDEEIFREIYESNWSRLFRHAYSILKDKAACQDIVQEIFIDLWKRRKALEINNLSSFLLQATKYKVFSYLRSSKISQEHLELLRNIELTNDTEDNLIAQDQERVIKKIAMEELPDRCRQIFLLSRFEQLSHQEIATQLGISIQTVRNQVSKALSILREKNFHSLLFVLIPILL